MSRHKRSRPVVAQVVQHLRPGGIESLVLELLEAEEKTGTRQIAISLESDVETLSAWPRLAALSDRVMALGKRPGLEPGLVPRLWRLFRSHCVSCVQTHHEGPLLYAGPAARLAGAHLVHVEHDAWHFSEPDAARRTRALLRCVRPHLIAVSEHVARAAEASVGLPFRVVANAVDADRFLPGDRIAARRSLGLPESGPVIVAAARLEPVKGLDILIAAMASMPGVHLAIAGEGSQRMALASLASRHAPGRVTFLGRLDRMPDLYRAGDVFALPSRNEGLPFALIEAQSSGCPAVACDVGAVASAVDPASGRLVPPEAPRLLAEALAERLSSSNLPSPRDFVLTRFSQSTMLASYSSLWTGGG